MKYAVLVLFACGLGCQKSCARPAELAKMPECAQTSTVAFTSLPHEQWAFQPFDGVRCGRSDNFGIAISKSTKTKRLLFFFLGGGACFDQTTCDRACNIEKQLCAANLDGFGAEQWARENRSLAGTIFDRKNPANPFRDDSWVFLPYCTGDFHSGTRRGDYGIDHRGWDAVSAVLARVAPTFCDVEQVVLYGVSAGGFGAVFNYEHVREAFPSKVKIDLVDDSGPLFSRAWMPLQEEMRRAWGSAKVAPSGCPECAESWEKYLPYLAKKYPEARFSFVSFEDDEVIAQGFGGPFADRSAFRRAMDVYATQVIEPLPNARYFLVPRIGHVLGKEQMSSTVAAGVTFADFLTQQVDGDPAWASVR